MENGNIIGLIKEEMPELQELEVSIGGFKLSLGDYERINAFIINNNVLDQQEKNIAIFHPKTDLLDIFLLIILGLSAYKESIVKNSKLRLNDFTPGELVEYEGKILLFNGVHVDSYDNLEKFQLIYGDEYVFSPTSVLLPLRYFPEISKYKGSKTKPDTLTSKGHKSNAKSALQKLLDVDGEIGYSAYSTFLISSERIGLIDLLRNVEISGIPFFEMFPSSKCTPGNTQRLGRDSVQRSSMFYFVSGLSTADDVLSREEHIKTLFVDARGKALKDGTLLASMRNQYQLEDMFMLQTYDRLESVQKLSDGLDFKIWIWDRKDFGNLKHNQNSRTSEDNAENEFFQLVKSNNSTVSRMTKYEDEFILIDYPDGFQEVHHKSIQQGIRQMFLSCNEYENPEMQAFTIHMAGVMNRIFQSPLSMGDMDRAMSDIERSTIIEDVDNLKERLRVLSYGPIPEEFTNISKNLFMLLSQAADAFRNYYGKLSKIEKIIQENPGKKISVVVNPKYAGLVTVLKEKLMEKLVASELVFMENILVTENVSSAVNFSDVIVWTYKPIYKDRIMIEPSVEKNIMLLYPLQNREVEFALSFNKRKFNPFMQPEYRASILKIPVDRLGRVESQNEIDPGSENDIDLEQLLSSALEKASSFYNSNNNQDDVQAKLVVFEDGTHTFFQTGHKIKVLDSDNGTVDTKTVSSLNEGDDVVFLKDSKRTVFEELVDFYQHKPEIIELVKMSELWRTALLKHKNKHYMHPVVVMKFLKEHGLERNVATIENWLDGTTICPTENNYEPVDVIAEATGDEELKSNIGNVKDAARKIHALRVKIGRYLAKKITQTYASPDSIIDDPVLKNKLDEISEHVRVVHVSRINNEFVKVPPEMTNRLLMEEDM